MTNAKSQRKSKTNSKQVIKRRKVTFSFEAVAAKEVFLTGDFNNWDPQKHP
jgi:1,4-alpha-glucan branching enzyme